MKVLHVAGAVLAAALIVAGSAGCGREDPKTARVRELRSRGDVQGLAGEVATQETPVARAAVQALGGLGREALPHIREVLSKDQRVEVREAAAVAYGQASGGEEMPPLAAAARSDPSPTVRAAAVTALGAVRALDEMETLIKAIEDPDRSVRERASSAVTRILGRRYEVYVDGTPEQRREGVEALRQGWAAMEPSARAYYKMVRESESR